MTGQAYFDFVDQFVQAVKQELPNVCLQWEDFATPHARPILERYRDELLTFNDDIQGTAAVALGAILGAVGVTGKRLRDQQIVFLGAGSAAVGVADYLRAALVQDGLSEAEARGRFWLVDKDGLLHTGRTDLTPEQRVYAQPAERVADWPRTSHGTIGLADVIGRIEATILIGLSTVGGAFTEPIVREMARKVERPVIFPLSNPTTRSEANAEDLIRWTGGRALVATGSPYRAGAVRGPDDPDRPVQQRVHLPGGRARRGRVRSPAGDRRDDAGRRPGAGRALPGADGPVRLAPARPAGHPGGGPGDRDGGRPGGPAGRASRRRRAPKNCATGSRPRSGRPRTHFDYTTPERRHVMAHTVAEHLVDSLAQAGVQRIYGIVGDSLNPVTDALRRRGSIQWVDVRHEETAAFAAGAEAQLTGRLAVCAGSCGPGNLHLINGLYDAHRSAAPVLAIAAHIPSSEVGTGYFQETHPDQLFRECSHYCELVSNPRQAPRVLQSAIQHAVSKRGVSVIVLPGDVAALEAPSNATARSPFSAVPLMRPADDDLARLADLLNNGKKVTLFCGIGCAGRTTKSWPSPRNSRRRSATASEARSGWSTTTRTPSE